MNNGTGSKSGGILGGCVQIKEEAIMEVFPVDPLPKSIGTSCNSQRYSNLCPHNSTEMRSIPYNGGQFLIAFLSCLFSKQAAWSLELAR